MKPFLLYNPVRLRVGYGQLDALSKEIPASARVLLVYGGGSVRRNGTLERVHALLKGRAETVVEFGGVQPNPEYAQLIEALPLIREHALDYVLAVGGGSVADGAKFIALAAEYEGEPWDLLEDPSIRTTAALPLGTVMTLPATGSEMNPIFVVSHRAQGRKLSRFDALVYPVFSIVEPELTETVPQRQIANGLVDAFIHTPERYIVEDQHTPLQARFSEGILQTLLEVGERTYRDPKDREARAAFCYAATMALNGMIGAGVVQDWSTHNIGHELTALYGLDHARSLAVTIFDNFELRWEQKRPRLAQMGRRVFGLEGDDETAARGALEQMRAFFESLDVPTSLTAYDNIDDDVADRVVRAIELRGKNALGENESVDLALVRKIVARSAEA